MLSLFLAVFALYVGTIFLPEVARVDQAATALDPADHRLRHVQMPNGIHRQPRQHDGTVRGADGSNRRLDRAQVATSYLARRPQVEHHPTRAVDAFGDDGELISAIEAVHRGEYLIDPLIASRVLSEFHLAVPELPRIEPLTESEMAILRLVAHGVDNQEIAQALHYSAYTVANRLSSMYEKLHVTNRTQAALYALHHGWAALDEPPG